MMKDDTRLDTWKEIADYLNKDVRTAIRWEKERGLPVHRMPGEKRSPVYAWKPEIDAWLGTANGIPANGQPVAAPKSPQPRYWLIGAALGFSLIPLLVWLPPQRPVLGNPVQITSDGHEKGGMAITATSLFYTLVEGTNTLMQRLDLATGKQSPVPIGFAKFGLMDASPDGSKLLLTDEGSSECVQPLWLVPTNGDLPRRLAGLCCGAAGWSPDGTKLAYASGPKVYLANADGTSPRRFATLPFNASHLRWSPDGNVLRVSLFGREIQEQTWEIPVDGSAPRRMLPGWMDYAGRWTPDGRFFLFDALHGGGFGLWALRERSRFAAWRDPGPFQLTSSLNGVQQPIFTKDGKKLFAIFTDPDRGELMRYDPSIQQFVAYLQPRGMSAGQTSFSPDGAQIAYIKYPELSLWKMNADGSNQHQLVERAALAQWSPDGRRIAYMGWDKEPNSPTKIRVISRDGDDLEEPVPPPYWQGAPNWTPDGNQLIFGENGPRLPIASSACLHRFDFKSRKTSVLPGTQGLWTARVSPAGRYVAAMTLDYKKLVLYDLQTAQRTDLASYPDRMGDNPTWSKDGRWLYYDTSFSAQPAIYRVSIPGKRTELVASLAGIPRVHGRISWWIGLTPDNLPLILKDIHSQEIYSMDWNAP